MKIGIQPIVKIGVRLPNLLQHCNIQTELGFFYLCPFLDLKFDQTIAFSLTNDHLTFKRTLPQLVYDEIVCVILESFEAESLISPILSKVAIHGVILKGHFL